MRLRDRYRIVAPLGRGTLGDVSVAEDEVTGERVAVRLLPRELSAEAVQRSRRSIIAASASHPAFVRVLDSGETSDGRSFMVMELAEGQGLHEVLAENEQLEIRDALRLALDLGGAIETLHNLGIVHAALRPCNVRILPQGRVKLLDLEIAGLRAAPELRDLLVEGSPAEYLAPEQVRGAPLSDKTDVYAFGLTLYELLCGAPPFRNSSREAVLSAQLDEAPPRLRRRRRGIPKGVQTLVSRALNKQPESRPFMSNLLNDLDDAASRPVTSWKRVAAVVGGVLVLASMAVPLVWDVFTPQPDAPRSSTPAPAAVTPAVPRGAAAFRDGHRATASRCTAGPGRDAADGCLAGARRHAPAAARAAFTSRDASGAARVFRASGDAPAATAEARGHHPDAARAAQARGNAARSIRAFAAARDPPDAALGRP